MIIYRSFYLTFFDNTVYDSHTAEMILHFSKKVYEFTFFKGGFLNEFNPYSYRTNKPR